MRAVIILAAIALCVRGEAGQTATNWQATGAFQRAVAGADRLVVRTGGALCCAPRADCKVLAVVADSNSLALAKARIRFEPTGDCPDCMCCGFPGIDWYRGTNLLAVTAVHHGESFHWVGSGGNERAELTQASAAWIAEWFARLGLPGTMSTNSAPRRRASSQDTP